MEDNKIIESPLKTEVDVTAGLKDAVINHSRKITEKTDQLVAWAKLQAYQVYIAFLFYTYFLTIEYPELVAAKKTNSLSFAEFDLVKEQPVKLTVEEVIADAQRVRFEAKQSMRKAYASMYKCELAIKQTQKLFDSNLDQK